MSGALHNAESCVDHRSGRVGALDVGLGDEHAGGRETSLDCGEGVALRCCVVPRDETDAAREGREAPLPLGREETLVCELRLEPFQRGQVVAEPEVLDRERPQAEVALGLEQLRPPEHVHAPPVLEPELERVEATAAHRHAEAGAVVRVLEREEDRLPALLALELRDLTLDPERRQPGEPVGHAPVEGGDRVDLAVAVLERLDLHASSLAPVRSPSRSGSASFTHR
jgi:hypothetical protein